MRSDVRALMGAVALALWLPSSLTAEPQSAVSDADLKNAIDRLGSIEYDTRTSASRLVRRTPPAQAVPALLAAIEEHDDGYVRYRALVLLSAFNNRAIPEVMRRAIYDPNDRLRAVAYAWFERHPDPSQIPTLIGLLERELSEFVRPSLVRAIVAQGADARVQALMLKDVNSGLDFFRSAVIEALGDYKATWAVDAIAAIAQLDGPLQNDAALALGKIGEQRALPVLAGLQRTAPREVQPSVAAALCLLGVNCPTHRSFLARTLTFAERTIGFQALLRNAAAGLGAVAATGDAEAARALFEVGIPSQDPARAPIALALASAAMANPLFLLDVLEKAPDRAGALSLLAEGFDMLDEDFAEEQFFATVRRTYWGAPEGSALRAVAEAVIGKLEF